MGKAPDPPEPPNYEPLARVSAEQADRAFALSQEQLDWSREQYAAMAPQIAAYTNAQLEALQFAQNSAKQQQAMYLETYAPVEQKFVNQVLAYGSPEYAAQRSAAAMADVARAGEGQREAAMADLASHGVDPSQLKYGALDLAFRVDQAARMAGAGTAERNKVLAEALALESTAIATGRGFHPDVANYINAGTAAGAAGAKAGTTAYATGAEAMGTPVQWSGQGYKGIDTSGTLMHYGAQDANQAYATQAKAATDELAGIGNIIGGTLAIGTRMMMPGMPFGR